MASSYQKGTSCDKLPRVWYILINCLIFILLLYTGIGRYLTFKANAFDPKYGGNWNQQVMNFTLGSIIAASFCFCLFFFTSTWHVDNFAHQGLQLGRDTDNVSLLASSRHLGLNTALQNGKLRSVEGHDDPLESATWTANSQIDGSALGGNNGIRPYFTAYKPDVGHLSWLQTVKLLLRRLWRHFLPIACFFHLLSAYCLLLPLPIMQAQQIYHRALPVDYVWQSELNIIFPPKASNLDTDQKSTPVNSWNDLPATSPEFVNLALALFLLALQYSNVFWYANRAFAMTLSLLLFLTGLGALIEFNAASLLTKLAWNQRLVTDNYPHLITTLLADPQQPFNTVGDNSQPSIEPRSSELALACPLLLSTLGSLLAIGLFTTVFEYGYRQFTDNLSAYRHYLIGNGIAASNNNNAYNTNPTDPYTTESLQSAVVGGGVRGQKDSASSDDMASVVVGGSSVKQCCPSGLNKLTPGQRLLHPTLRCCMHPYSPHVAATVGLILTLAFKLPIVWDCILAYQHSNVKHPVLLVTAILDSLLTCSWLIAWFAFSLKPSWKFQINLPLHAMTATASTPFVGPYHQAASLYHTHRTQENMLPTSGSLLRRPILLNTDQLAPGQMATVNGSTTGSPVYACFHHHHQDNGQQSVVSSGNYVVRNQPSDLTQPDLVDNGQLLARPNGGNTYVCLQGGISSAGTSLTNPILTSLAGGGAPTLFDEANGPLPSPPHSPNHDATSMFASPTPLGKTWTMGQGGAGRTLASTANNNVQANGRFVHIQCPTSNQLSATATSSSLSPSDLPSLRLRPLTSDSGGLTLSGASNQPLPPLASGPPRVTFKDSVINALPNSGASSNPLDSDYLSRSSHLLVRSNSNGSYDNTFPSLFASLGSTVPGNPTSTTTNQNGQEPMLSSIYSVNRQQAGESATNDVVELKTFSPDYQSVGTLDRRSSNMRSSSTNQQQRFPSSLSSCLLSADASQDVRLCSQV